jgi:hypothetical protein
MGTSWTRCRSEATAIPISISKARGEKGGAKEVMHASSFVYNVNTRLRASNIKLLQPSYNFLLSSHVNCPLVLWKTHLVPIPLIFSVTKG